MKKIHPALIIAFAFFVQTIAPFRAVCQDVSKLVKRVKPSVVTIFCYNADGEQYGQGTGFFIDSEDIITCHHVLESAARAECVDDHGKKMEITSVISAFLDADLVKARVAVPVKQKGLRLAKHIPEEGEELVVIGTPHGLEMTVSNGIVSSIRTNPNQVRDIQMTVPVSNGSSGSPVLNMKGEVVGVAKYIIDNAENLNFATMSENILQMHDQQPTPLKVWSSGLHEQASGSEEDWNEGSPEEQKRAKKFAEYSFEKGTDFFDKKNYEAARAAFESSVDADPSNPRAWFQLGMSEDGLREYRHAAEDFAKALSLKHDITTLYYLMDALYLSRNFEGAEKACMELIEMKPSDPKVWNGIGKCFFALEMDSEAIGAFKMSIKYKSDFAEPHGMLSIIYIKERRFDEAEKELNYAVLYDGTADILDVRGDFYAAMGRRVEAIAAWRQALARAQETGADSNSADMLHVLGDSLFGAGYYREALSAMKLALVTDPHGAVMHHDAGSCFCKLNMYDSAIVEYKLAVKYDSTCIPCYMDLGRSEIDFNNDKAAALSDCNSLRYIDSHAADQLLEYIRRH